MPLGVGEVFAGYTVVQLLGSGGMGEVYLVKHPRLPRQDALKVLPGPISSDADFRTRFEREADLAASLWHPHIVGVHDRGEDDGRLWIAMDYVEGSDAAKLCREQFPQGMPARDVAEIVVAVAEALDYAHEQQLLHRDVKPANILLTDTSKARRRILLADFGIARQADDANGLTATNMTVGSVSYTAPEQLMGGTVDGRVDQYSLAATAYHLLTGSPPFAHSNSAVVISRHLSAPPPQAADIRPELAGLDPILAKALAKDPADRYDTCLEFAEALREQANATSQDSEATVIAQPVARPDRPDSGGDRTEHVAAASPAEPTVHQAAPPLLMSSWGTPPTVAEPAPARIAPPPPRPVGTPATATGKPSLDPRMIVGAVAVVLVAFVLTIIVVSGGDDHTTSTPSTSRTANADNDTGFDTTVQPASPTSIATPVSVRPPDLVQAPDAFQERCGNGVPLPGKAGWAARGGRGTADTSCYFSYSVLKAYWDRYPSPSRERRQVVAEGAVPCDRSTAQCAGSQYVMTCEAVGGDAWITCTGGRNARVYLY
ncbi:MAG TPA: serine/threonine-protein kinase [Mycobacterium sp.]